MDVSNTIFVDAGTSVEQGIIGDPAAPFSTIDAAVRAGNAFRPRQEWTLEIVPGVYQMEMPLYIGYLFTGTGDDDIPIINIRTVQEWANLTFTNVRLVIDRIYTEDDRLRATVNILFDFNAEKGVDIHDDCYIDVIQTIEPPLPTLPIVPFANLSGAVFKCSANSSVNLEPYNFTFLNNNIPLDPQINLKTAALITLPANMNIRTGTLLRNNSRNNSSISISVRKGTKYQSIIRSTERIVLGQTITSSVTISDPDRQYSMAFTNNAIMGNTVLGFIVSEDLEEENTMTSRRRLCDDEVPEGPINANLRADIEATNETITMLSRQYQDDEPTSLIVLLESTIANDDDDAPLIEIEPTLDQPNLNPLLSSNTIICGFLLPNTERIAGKNCSVLINNTQEGGSTLVSGSDLNAITIIKENYTHNYFDGKYFLVDASEGDITIKIPKQTSQSSKGKFGRKCKDEQPWQGRVLKYKRIDDTLNKVRIINQRGLIDNKHRHISLDNKKIECKCDKVCLAKKTLIVRFDGSAYTF